jgi:glyceraldehyde 3-phosphate dehydrogenase
MTITIAINGYGRIGRNILRAVYETKRHKEINIVAINDLGDIQTNAHLTKYDSTHGTFAGEVSIDGNDLIVNDHKILGLRERDPQNLPWQKLGIDVVLECTGLFATSEKSQKHLAAGAKKVLISAPAGPDVDATVVYGVNHHILSKDHKIVSNASCTTNCLAPLAMVLNKSIGIESGLMTTIHSYTNDQVLVDVYHTDLHRARAAAHSMIPTKTGAAAAIGLVLPELDQKLDGFAMRVPTLNVSIVDLTFKAKRATTVQEVNSILAAAAKGELSQIAATNELPLVSIDFNHNPASCIFDLTQTKVLGDVVKVLAWYDNEWGFSNRMIDTAIAMMRA